MFPILNELFFVLKDLSVRQFLTEYALESIHYYFRIVLNSCSVKTAPKSIGGSMFETTLLI